MNSKKLLLVLILLGILGWLLFDGFYGPADVIVEPHTTEQQTQK